MDEIEQIAMTGKGDAGERQWPRYLLGLAAAIELMGGLNDWPALTGDLTRLTGHTLSGGLVVLKIAAFPLLALTALVFVVINRVQPALLAFAAMIMLTWLGYLPSLASKGLDVQGDLVVNAQFLFQYVLLPLIALAIAFLALARDRYKLATLLAVLPTAANLVALIAFAVGLGIYGF